jgi:4-alpha-glucanotransferase
VGRLLVDRKLKICDGTTGSSISRLAAENGIASEFLNARGEAVSTDGAVQARLLECMGALTAQGQACDSGIIEQTGAEREALVVTAEGGRITLYVADQADSPSLDWNITFEDGSKRSGSARVTSINADGASRSAIILSDIPYGYHELRIGGSVRRTSLIVSPGRCWLPDEFSIGKSWGISLQLYLLRSARNWGIGDFTDLTRFSVLVAGLGCDVLGLNPLHQMFPDKPEHASPYSPATRYFLNVLYIDVESIPEFRSSVAATALLQSQDFQKALSDCRSADLVDYSAVAELKMRALRVANAEFCLNASGERRRKFQKFVDDHGANLAAASLFQVLRGHFSQIDAAKADWHSWPVAFRSANSGEVHQFAGERSDEIQFFSWLEWIADQQLEDAKQAAIKAGMRIGFYRDLAVGCDRSGSETWSRPVDFMVGAEVGAPPDILNPSGQNWGLPPFNPRTLRKNAFKPFIELVRANMRHAGGLRIDHVMGLQRLYCIPEGSAASTGAYVSYPIEDLIGILALESHRNRCFVVGEDLGTVPTGFRERMSEAAILSYRVLFFEQDDEGKLVPAEQYPKLAVAVAGSHDLPTLRGWLCAGDIELKESLGLYSTEDELASQLAMRSRERSAVLAALELEAEKVEQQVFSMRSIAFSRGPIACWQWLSWMIFWMSIDRSMSRQRQQSIRTGDGNIMLH